MKSQLHPASVRKGFLFGHDSERAFTRVDMLAVIVSLIVLAGWFGFNHSGERGRMARCSRNLQVLGEAMHSFANDHRGGLPPAGVEDPQTTWDQELLPYLAPQTGKSNPPLVGRNMLKAVAPRFFCPSDPIQRGERPRSYAMSAHDMKPENWPPGPDNTTGVGLWWSKEGIQNLLGKEIAEQAGKNSDALAAVKLSFISDPAGTLLLTELAHRDNRLASVMQVRLSSVDDQLAAFRGDLSHFHGGQFNYLMVDGHVESLSPFQPLQAVKIGGSAGIWSINKGN